MQGNYKTGYIPELDGLRGIAIIGVLFFHAQVPFFGGTYIGVDIFFVLSGFLITRILINEFDRVGDISLKNFYIRRILRLGPALIALLIVFWIMSFALLSKQAALHNTIEGLLSLVYFTNWVRAFSIYPTDYLSHTWSLAIEEQFYIFWPILLLTLLRVSKRRINIVFFASFIALLSWIIRILLLISGATINRIYYGLDTRIDGLMIGCVLGTILSSGLLREHQTKTILKALVFLAPISVGGIIIIAVFSRMVFPSMYLFGFIILEILVGFLILDIVINPQSITGNFLNNQILRRIGKISYGVYLWHHPIFRVIQSYGFNYFFVLALGSTLTFIIASISYIILEQPILTLKNKFITSPQNN